MNELLTAKIALEAELTYPLLRYLTRYVSAAVARPLGSYEAIAQQNGLERLLASHYARVVMVVTGQRPPKGATVEDAAIDLDHLRSMRERATAQAGFILRGIDREIQRVETKSLETKKEGLGSKLLAKAREVMAKVKSRIGSIVNAQTNPPAEEARGIEARRAAGNRALFKEWSSMRDNAVRHAHELAEGQIQLVSRPFVLGDDRLMFPGDGSLGASLGNIVNCRCSALFFTRDEHGNRVDLSQTARLTPVAPNRTVRTITDPAQITNAVRLHEGMIQEVFLSDMSSARVSIRQGVIRVTRGGRRLAIGRFTHGIIRGPRVEGLVLSPGAPSGINELIARSLSR